MNMAHANITVRLSDEQVERVVRRVIGHGDAVDAGRATAVVRAEKAEAERAALRSRGCDINEDTHYCRTHHQDLDVPGITCVDYWRDLFMGTGGLC